MIELHRGCPVVVEQVSHERIGFSTSALDPLHLSVRRRLSAGSVVVDEAKDGREKTAYCEHGARERTQGENELLRARPAP